MSELPTYPLPYPRIQTVWISRDPAHSSLNASVVTRAWAGSPGARPLPREDPSWTAARASAVLEAVLSALDEGSLTKPPLSWKERGSQAGVKCRETVLKVLWSKSGLLSWPD